MTRSKRLLDLVLLALMAPALLPLLGLLCLVLWAAQGRPIFYGAERMRSVTEGFTLWKLRSMTGAARDSGVSGGDKAGRITPMGRRLRRVRLDEVPQMLNILRGDISFVGPRPPLREYVERFPAIYEQVLRARPGVTGLASLVYAGHEALLLARCTTPEETDAVYARACVPRKARLDLIYQRHQSVGFDLWLVAVTAARVFGLAKGRRLPRPPLSGS
jgi:lipopolysaccharide/colanic/teichoic acid biosynthesis glycosyltransferase